MASLYPGFSTSPAQRAALYYARKANRNTVAVTDVTAPASGSILFPANPSNSQSITIATTSVIFGTHVSVGASLPATLASLLAYLQASSDVNLVKHTYSVSATALGIKAKTVGVVVALAASNATVSASTTKQPTITAKKPL